MEAVDEDFLNEFFAIERRVNLANKIGIEEGLVMMKPIGDGRAVARTKLFEEIGFIGKLVNC